ncbi:sulfotransferase [Thalassobaculum sp.]|uniref:sulfotransferase n=1 Tax=Thalassobaculum sp. TaxID=2022740 RepID=UPI0032EC5BC5
MPFVRQRLRVAADALRRGSGNEAGRKIRPALLQEPRNPDATILAALAARNVNRPELAARLFRWALVLRPGDPHALGGLAEFGARVPPAGDRAAVARIDASRDPGNPGTWAAAGWSALSAGRPADTWMALRRACVLAPGDRSGLAMTILAERRHARRVDWSTLARRALVAGPAHPPILVAVLVALREARDGPGMVRIGRRMAMLAPDSDGAYQGLCAMAEAAVRSRDRRAALRLVTWAEAMRPYGPAHAGVRARLLRAAGRIHEAIDDLRDRLRRHPEDDASTGLAFDLAAMLDQTGDTDGAVQALTMANRAARARARADGADRRRFLALLERFEPASMPAMQPPAGRCGTAPPAFVFGMPRSGTTLVGDILHRHPLVEVFDEPELLPETVRTEAGRLGAAGVDLAGIAAGRALDPACVSAMRDTFGRLLRRREQHPGKPLKIDKSPLGIVYAGLVAQLFPGAPTVFVLRHPADVCLSCLMQEFASTDALASFNAVEEVAELYDRVMSFWSQASESLALRVHTVRYEALIADPEAESRRLTDFLGLDWTPDLLDPARAAGRYIATPSYHQVEQSIHSRALGRWTRYRDYLAPAMPRLESWIRRLGYSDP